MASKTRTPGPKVKTGCITCKIRRVKCDEAKPSCNRCTSTGRKCDGYASQANSLALVPFKSRIPTISFDLAGTPRERRGFRYFRDCAAPELAGYFTEGFWDYTLLQGAMSNPALKHAVVAFGTLHEKFALGELVAAPQESDYLFSMQQYSRAVVKLRQSLEVDGLPPEVVLIASIVLTSFDNMRGSFNTALLHLESGLKVLKDWINYPNHTHAERMLVEKNIRPLFIRLGIQAIIFADMDASRNIMSIWADIVRASLRAPDDFTNLDDARFVIEAYSDNIAEFPFVSEPLAGQNLPMDKVTTEQKRHLEFFQKWGKAFDAFLLKTSSSLTGKELRAASLLKIHWLTATVMVNSSLSGVQSYEKLTPMFQTIVNLSSSLLAAESKNSALSFKPELGIVASLYFTSLKCRVPAIRAEAIHLLRSTHRREGMWDSITEAQIAQSVMDLENNELDADSRVLTPPEFHTSSHDCNARMTNLFRPDHQEVEETPPQHYPIYRPDGSLRGHGGGPMRCWRPFLRNDPSQSSTTSTSAMPPQSMSNSSTMNIASSNSKSGTSKLRSTLPYYVSTPKTSDISVEDVRISSILK